MRKIEHAMCDAIQGKRDWQRANTKVRYVPEIDTTHVYLHGNLIATINRDKIRFMHAGWQTHTTKSRLNAIARCTKAMGVFQHKGGWFYDNATPFFGGSYAWRREDEIADRSEESTSDCPENPVWEQHFQKYGRPDRRD